jgi:hypothetical protein
VGVCAGNDETNESCHSSWRKLHLADKVADRRSASNKEAAELVRKEKGEWSLSMTVGVICAFVGLFIFPEVLDSAAIILGARTWRKEEGNRGLGIVILGIACMIVGLYFTSIYSLGTLLNR